MLTPGAMLRELAGHQRGRAAQHDGGAELREQVDVGAGHAAVRDVADDGDAQAFERRAVIEDGAGVEQRLGGVLVGAVAGVDDGGARQVARQEVGRAGSGVAHHDGVRAHGDERVQRIDERLALGDAGAGGGDGDGVRAEALGGDFEAGAGARGGLEEEVDDHAAFAGCRSAGRTGAAGGWKSRARSRMASISERSRPSMPSNPAAWRDQPTFSTSRTFSSLVDFLEFDFDDFVIGGLDDSGR